MTAEQLAAIERIRAYKPPFYKWMNYDPADAIALLDALDAATLAISEAYEIAWRANEQLGDAAHLRGLADVINRLGAETGALKGKGT
jgi:hypothetical protein